MPFHGLRVLVRDDGEGLDGCKLDFGVFEVETLKQQGQERLDFRHEDVAGNVPQQSGQGDKVVRFCRRVGASEERWDASSADVEDFLLGEQTNCGAVLFG